MSMNAPLKNAKHEHFAQLVSKGEKASGARKRKRALLGTWRPVNGIPASNRLVRG